VEETSRQLAQNRVNSADDVRDLGIRIVRFSDELGAKNRALKSFLLKEFYRHYRMVRMSQKAQRMIGELFHAYLNTPAQLPFSVSDRACEAGDLPCIICDYIAGMTDRYAVEEYQKLFDPAVRV
jgi:dGTPase